MAKYILTFSTDRPAGSLGGATFQKSGTVFTIRKRNVPVQKKSPAQSIVKNRFDHVQKEWKNFTPIEKTSFANEAPNYPRTNSLGDIYYLSASNLQASSNLNLIAVGEPPITSMPPVPVFPALVLFQYGIDLADESFVANITPNPIPAGVALKIYATAPLQTFSLNPSSIFKLITTVPPGFNQFGSNYWAEYLQAWGSPNGFANKFVGVKVAYIDLATGVESDSVSAVGDIAP